MLRNSAGAIYITEGEDEDDFQEADKEEERVRKNLDVFSDQSIATDENDKKLLEHATKIEKKHAKKRPRKSVMKASSWFM